MDFTRLVVVPRDGNESVCTFCFLKILAYLFLIVLQTISDSFAPQEVISYDIPHQRVWIELPALVVRLYLLVIQENPELLDARQIACLSRNSTPVNFLDLGSTFSCASTSLQVSPECGSYMPQKLNR